MYQEAAQAARVAAETARREQWPAGLLEAVLIALEDADPAGLNWFAGQGDRWAGVLEALANVQEARPADAKRLAPLVAIAVQGAGISDSVPQKAEDAAIDFGSGVAEDLRALGKGAADTAQKAFDVLPWLLGAAAVGAGWYYLAGPGRGRA